MACRQGEDICGNQTDVCVLRLSRVFLWQCCQVGCDTACTSIPPIVCLSQNYGGKSMYGQDGIPPIMMGWKYPQLQAKL